jgi:hypothetical protein
MRRLSTVARTQSCERRWTARVNLIYGWQANFRTGCGRKLCRESSRKRAKADHNESETEPAIESFG